MTLSFNTKINGNPTCFVEKIHEGIFHYLEDYKDELFEFQEKYIKTYGDDNYRFSTFIGKKDFNRKTDYIIINQLNPKIHTLRNDPKDCWHPGRLIHFVINNRTKNRFQFAPVIPVISTQIVDIIITSKDRNGKVSGALVYVDGQYLGAYSLYGKLPSTNELNEFAINDGFQNVEEFFEYFCESQRGLKLIHWTDKRY